MGGSDDPDNLVSLSIEDHAEAHRILYEEHGNQFDYIAWKTLSGQITSDEARRLAVSFALKGKPKSDEQRRKMSIARKARGGITTGMTLPMASEERKKKISEANKGKAYRGIGWSASEETKKKMSLAMQNLPKIPCPKCGKEMTKANISRYHGLNGEKCRL